MEKENDNKTKEFHPYFVPPTPEGKKVGMAVAKRYLELIGEGESTVSQEEFEEIKHELSLTIRKETGNVMCTSELAKIIDDIASEHVDDAIKYCVDEENGCLPMVKLISRIENEVLHFDKI